MHNLNSVKTVILLGLMGSVLVLGGGVIAGRQGLYWGLSFAIAANIFSYFFSDKLALRMSGAMPLSQNDHPEIYARVAPLVASLCQRMGLPMPKLYLTAEESPNAFATGRNPAHASVAFTHGILQLMDNCELEGVVAHELGHVLHRDILISSVAATLAAAITGIARMAFFFGGSREDEEDRGGNAIGAILMLLLAPIAATLIQLAISRMREFEADEASAKYTGNPYELISALQKLDIYAARVPLDTNPATHHLWIIKPFTGESILKMFSTHPSTEERIARLRRISGGMPGMTGSAA